MRKSLTVQEMIEQYLETGRVITETTMTGDYKRGNAMVRKNAKVNEKLSQDMDLAAQVLSAVMTSDVDQARSLAACTSLRFGILIEEALCVLKEIEKRTDMVGFGAEMALKRWRGEVPSGDWRDQQ